MPFIEEEGLATTGISLVREHTEGMRPPRFLWVPFPLGRPLGVPSDPAFQHRVLLATLRLLEAEHGPVLEDFPEDAPLSATADRPGAVCPVGLPRSEAVAEDDLAGLFLQEIAQLAPWYELAVATRHRTTVGLSGLAPREAGQFLGRFLNETTPTSYGNGLSLGEAFKLASEDVKAYISKPLRHSPEPPLTQHWHSGSGTRRRQDGCFSPCNPVVPVVRIAVYA